MATNTDQLRISLIHFDKSGAWGKLKVSLESFKNTNIQYRLSLSPPGESLNTKYSSYLKLKWTIAQITAIMLCMITGLVAHMKYEHQPNCVTCLLANVQ